MDLADDLGLGQREDVGVAAEVVAVVGERLAAVVGLAELVPLDQGPHRAVDHQDPLPERARERLGRVGPLGGVGHGSPLGSGSATSLGTRVHVLDGFPDGDTGIVAPARISSEIVAAA